VPLVGSNPCEGDAELSEGIEITYSADEFLITHLRSSEWFGEIDPDEYPVKGLRIAGQSRVLRIAEVPFDPIPIPLQ